MTTKTAITDKHIKSDQPIFVNYWKGGCTW